MKKSFSVFLFVCLVLCLSGGEFKVAATADLHGNLRALSFLAPAIRNAKPDLTVDAGDLTGGNLLAELDGGASMIEALNMLNFQFRIPGNHDFEMPSAVFAGQCARFKGITLGADWRWGSVTPLPCAVVRKGAFKAGIIGLTEPDIHRRFLPIPGMPGTIPWQQALSNAVKQLRKEKVNALILVWHCALDNRYNGPFQAARLFPEIDLIICAHSHKENPGVRYRSSYFVQPGAYASSAALVKIHYDDKTLKVSRITSTLLRGNAGAPAPDLAALNKNAVKPFYKDIYRKVCRKGDLSAKNFPRLAAQALAEAGKTQGAVFTSAIPDKYASKGDCYKDLFRIIPYWNILCTVELTRSELKAFLEDLHKNNRKFKRTTGIYGFQWTPGRGRKPGVFRAPEKLRITVNSYTMTSSPVLKKLLKTPGRWHSLPLVERDIVEKFLRNRLHRGGFR